MFSDQSSGLNCDLNWGLSTMHYVTHPSKAQNMGVISHSSPLWFHWISKVAFYMHLGEKKNMWVDIKEIGLWGSS